MKINKHTSHPSAFISSTFVDLFEDRDAVAEALSARGLNVNALDIKPASAQTSKAEIINGIKESDFVILIIGDRYGSTLESMTGNPTKSITWWEYDIAMRSGKPVIAYFKNYNSHDPKSHDDKSNPLYERNRKLFEKFKILITRRHNPSYYTDPIELSGKVNKSLISIYRAGVKTLDSKNAELNLKVSQLEAEVNTLRAQLSSFNTPEKPAYNQGLGGAGLSSIGFGAFGTNTENNNTKHQGLGLSAALTPKK